MVSDKQIEDLNRQRQGIISKALRAGVLDIEKRIDDAECNFKTVFWSHYNDVKERDAYALMYAIMKGSGYMSRCAEYEIEGRKGGYQRKPTS